MNYFWRPCRVICCLIRQARVGDQSFWRESKKLLSWEVIEKAGHRAALSEKEKLKKVRETTHKNIDVPLVPSLSPAWHEKISLRLIAVSMSSQLWAGARGALP